MMIVVKFKRFVMYFRLSTIGSQSIMKNQIFQLLGKFKKLPHMKMTDFM
jgi:hypothetical protein